MVQTVAEPLTRARQSRNGGMDIPTQGNREQAAMTVERMILETVNGIREDIKGFQTKDAAEAETRRINGELAHQAQDILDERSSRETAIKDVKELLAKTSVFARWIVGLVIGLVATLIGFWISLGGPA